MRSPRLPGTMRTMKRTESHHRRHRARACVSRLSCLLLVAAFCSAPLSACAVQSGSDEIAFLQGTKLWMVQRDGSGARSDSQNPVLDFAWSPDHHQLVFRYTGPNPATAPESVLATAADAPADLAIQSVNGGYALQITPAHPGELRSAVWWDADGNRLIYRETAAVGEPPLYIDSQADQPVGIGRKILLDDASLPALAPDGKQVAVLDPSGAVRVGAPGALGKVVATGALLRLSGADGGRPARVLWQPQRDALLYATASASGVAFVLRDLVGDTTRTVATTAVALDAAFSPDGTLLLVRTPSGFELWNTAGGAAPIYSWPESDLLALPWWSPNSHAILVQDHSGWTLVDVPGRHTEPVLAFPAGAALVPATSSSTTWTPATGDPWSPDGTQVVVAAAVGSQLNGKALPPPQHGDTGLYVLVLRSGHVGDARLIVSGEPRAPAWGYAAPDTVFLTPRSG